MLIHLYDTEEIKDFEEGASVEEVVRLSNGDEVKITINGSNRLNYNWWCQCPERNDFICKIGKNMMKELDEVFYIRYYGLENYA